MSDKTPNNPKTIAIIATEDWFVLSHFRPLIEALLASKFKIYVLARGSNASTALTSMGCTCINLPLSREKYGIKALYEEYKTLKTILATLSPDMVHVIALRMCVLAGFAAAHVGIKKRIFAITGMGVLAISKSIKAFAARLALRFIMRKFAKSAGGFFIFENTQDPKTLGVHRFTQKLFFVPGAGVDVGLYPPTPWPPMPPLKIATLSRMIKSKGVDLCAEAVSDLHQKGYPITLSIFGGCDSANPQSYTQKDMEKFASMPGVVWHNTTNNVAKVWREHHVALFLSRGGEGLPKSMLEAAAAARPIITSNVPGCAQFVNEHMGFCVKGTDKIAVQKAILELFNNPNLAQQMGLNARKKIMQQHTTQLVEANFKTIYDNISTYEVSLSCNHKN